MWKSLHQTKAESVAIWVLGLTKVIVGWPVGVTIVGRVIVWMQVMIALQARQQRAPFGRVFKRMMMTRRNRRGSHTS